MSHSDDTIDDILYQIAELGRKLHLASGISGVVVSHDPAAGVVVDIGYETHAMPTGDNEGEFSPLRKGQLVHVYCPSGDLANAFCKPAGYSDQVKPPSTSTKEKVWSKPGGGLVRSIDDGVLHLEATSLAKLKIVVGGQTFTIKPEALQPA